MVRPPGRQRQRERHHHQRHDSHQPGAPQREPGQHCSTTPTAAEPSGVRTDFQSGGDVAHLAPVGSGSAWYGRSLHAARPFHHVPSSASAGLPQGAFDALGRVGPWGFGATSVVGSASAPPAGLSTVSAAGHMVQAVTSTGAWSGPTFALTRGGTNKDTEGLMAPALFRQLDLTTMLDVASAFDTEQEVRDACRSASQQDQDLAVRAWTQSNKRAPYITTLMARQLASLDRPTGPTPTTTITCSPSVPFTPFHPPPPDPRPFAAPATQPDLSLVVHRDAQVDLVKQGYIDALLDVYYDMGPVGLQWGGMFRG